MRRPPCSCSECEVAVHVHVCEASLDAKVIVYAELDALACSP